MSDLTSVCKNCCHPAYMHRDPVPSTAFSGGCCAALYASQLSALALTGCSCTHTPEDFTVGVSV